VYQLTEGAARLSKTDVAALSHDDHLRYFMIFLYSLLQDFASYVAGKEARSEPIEDILYSKAPLYLTDGERDDLLIQFNALLQPFMREDASGERRRYLAANVFIPDDSDSDDKREEV
jgi:hypothetical protein